ncbi:UNVERIFIED_CONTAM: hypothetical protein RMT77_009028 [Armadillidium vulgare]
MNMVKYLLEHPFSLLENEQKLAIKNLGPYQPRDVRITQHDGKRVRNFTVTWFDRISWLTVCEEREALFCFYCLLFGGDVSWGRYGVKDLKHLSERINKHECSKVHINNIVQLSMLDKDNILSKFDPGHRLEVAVHNEQVDKNRLALSKIIDYLKFCGSQMILSINREKNNKSNIVFNDILCAFPFNNLLNHQEAIKNDSDNVHDDLLEFIYQVYLNEIQEEINSANFVSLQVDDVTDISCGSKVTVILRFMKDSLPYERFLGFINIPNKSPDQLERIFMGALKPFKITSKLVAHSYGGGTPVILRSLISALFPYARCLHSYAHSLDLVIKKTCSSNEKVKVFFATLSGIFDFFDTSTNLKNLLEGITNTPFFHNEKTSYDFDSKLVYFVTKSKEELLECFNRIQNEDGWDDESLWKSSTFERALKDEEFNYFLSFSFTLLKHIEDLKHALQSNSFSVADALLTFQLSIEQMRSFGTTIVTESVVTDYDVPFLPAKKLKQEEISDDNGILQVIAKETCSKVITEIKDRFNNYDIFRSFVIIDPKQFYRHRLNFPIDCVQIIKTNYSMINIEKLTSELTILYGNETFENISSISSLWLFLHGKQLDETFSETCKLIEIALVTPVISKESERCFNTTNDVRRFLKNSKFLNLNLNAQTVLFLHYDYILGTPNFNKKVIEKYAQVKNKEEYLYK